MILLPAFAFIGMSDTELMLVLVVVLIFFGGSKMPELAKGMGKALREFRRATGEVEREFKRVMEEAEHETVTPFKTAVGTVVHGANETLNEIASTQPSPPPSVAEPAAAAPSPAVPPPPPAAPAYTPPPPPHRLQPRDGAEDFHSDI